MHAPESAHLTAVTDGCASGSSEILPALHAVPVWWETRPTQGTVNKTLSELWSDSPLLNRVLTTSIAAMDRDPGVHAMERITQLAILARCMQRAHHDSDAPDSIDEARSLLVDLQQQLVRISGI